MSKIAIFSDVHGNLPALTTVLQDIEERNADQVFCLGDLVDQAPWTNEVIDTIRNRHISCLMGNHDERIAFDYEIITLQKHSEEERLARVGAIHYTRNTITAANKNYLAGLTSQIKLRFHLRGKSIQVLLVHGSTRSNDEYIYAHHRDEDLTAMMEQQQADILVMGHTHVSFIKRIAAAPGGPEKLVVNCGSVGRSKEGQPLANYLLLDIKEQGVDATIIKLAYPVTETITAIRNSGIPAFYAEFLELQLNQLK